MKEIFKKEEMDVVDVTVVVVVDIAAALTATTEIKNK